ncbi:MAG TPA: extracellular solute-binding protein [Devosia sp.]|nr:extracellular solute-binding protein [Devosia sp.]
MLKLTNGLAIAVALAGMLTAAAARADGVTLTLSRWAGPQADAQQPLLDEYAKLSGDTIKLDAIDYGQLKQKQTLNMSTKTGAYDLIYVPEAWFNEYADAGYLTKLDDMVKDPALTGADWDFADFSKSSLGVYTAKDGSLQALPYFAQTPLLVYNKDEFAKANLQPPKTWDDLLKAAKYFHDQGTGIALPFKQGPAITNVMAVLLAGDNTDFFGKDGKLDLTDPAVVETVKFMQQLSQYELNGSNGWHWDEVNKVLQFGQAPLGITISGLFTALEDPKQSSVAGHLGYLPIPYNKAAAGLLQTWAWAVPADSKNPKEAFKLAAWLDSKKALTEMSTADPSFISFRSSLASDPELAKHSPWLAAAADAFGHGVTLPLQAAAPQLLDALATGLSGVVTSGTDPAAMLADVQSKQAANF